MTEAGDTIIPTKPPSAPATAGTSEKSRSRLQAGLHRVNKLKHAADSEGHTSIRLGLAGVFLIGVLIATALIAGTGDGALLIICAGIIGGYMALNIGANDVANNMGPAVGSRALTMVGALVVAAVFETAGAVLAGGDVVSTIAKGIIDPEPMADTGVFITAMMAALLAAALWLNLATYIGAPVSTTHAIVGGVMGSGIAATGIAAVNWSTMAAIAASWVISPILGGVIAAGFLWLVRKTIIFQPDRIAAARRWVPVFVGFMAAAFAMYLITKGLKQIWKPSTEVVFLGGIALFFISWFAVRPFVVRQSEGLENRKRSIHGLFSAPLICAAAMLSFAHGANDVANAVGPLAAIVSALSSTGIAAKVQIPLWVLVVGACGISFGLVLFGPRLIRTVGEKITKLNPIRAFCVALSAAITVLIASALGLPVSSTHIAVGGVFGVGFLREVLHNRILDKRRAEAALALAATAAPATSEPAPGAKGNGKGKGKGKGNDDPDRQVGLAPPTKKKKRKFKLVRRKHLTTIITAWLVTVPLAAILAAVLFLVLHWGRMAFL